MSSLTTAERDRQAKKLLGAIRTKVRRQNRDFLGIAQDLRELRALYSKKREFDAVVADGNLGIRAVHDYLTIVKFVDKYGMKPALVNNIGPGRMAVLVRCATPETVHDLSEKAVALSEKAFEVYARQVRDNKDGKPIEPVTRVSFTLHFTVPARDEIRALLKELAPVFGGGSKDEALLTALRLVSRARKNISAEPADAVDCSVAEGHGDEAFA